jgi:predicted ATPase
VFVSLAGLDPESIPGRIASALGIPEQTHQTPLEALDERALSGKWTIVLDNCERVEAQTRAAIERLRERNDIAILATSRTRLFASDEIVVEISPFTLEDASAFFAARAALSGARADPRIEHPAEVTRIVTALDGLAVAIDLAAARLASLSVAELAAELESPRPYHFRSQSSREPRHWTINRVVDWSFEQLDAPMQEAFVIAGRFASVFEAGDLAAILRCEFDDAQLRLEGLADRSLLVRSAHPNYFSMLSPIRSVARRRFEQYGKRAAFEERYFSRLNALAADLRDRIETSDGAQARELLSMRYEDCIAAMEAALEGPRARIAPVLSVFQALVSLWADAGRFTDGLRWCERFVAAIAFLEPTQQGVVLYGALRVAYAAAEYDRMLELGPQIISAFSIAGDRLGLARAYNGLGVASMYTGRFDEAITYVDTALALYQTIGYERGIATALMNRGSIAIEYRFDAASAVDCYLRAMEIFERTASDAMMAVTHGNLAEAYDELHDIESAQRHAVAALASFTTVGDRARAAWLRQVLARLALQRQDRDAAASELNEAFTLLETVPNPGYLAGALETATRLLAERRRFPDAALLGCAALRLRRERRVPATGPALRDASAELQRVARRGGDDALRDAAKQADAIGLADLPAIARRALAQTSEASGDTMVEGP